MFNMIKKRLGNKALDNMTEAVDKLTQSLVAYQSHVKDGNIEMMKVELANIADASNKLANGASILKHTL